MFGKDVPPGYFTVRRIPATICSAGFLALGVPYPPLKERFEMLEESLQIALQMWSDDDGPFDGKHYHLAETINAPLQIPARR